MAEQNKPGHFDICKAMAKRNLDIRMATLDNIKNIEFVRRKPRNGGPVTFITIGLEGELWRRFQNNEFVGGLILCDAKQYRTIQAELAEAPDARFNAWMMGVEFGLKQHEQGRNLQFALDEARKVYTGKP